MEVKRTVLGAVAYTVVTFPLAVLWHVGLFGNLYQRFGYFSGEPSFLIGLLAILLQGIILSGLYPLVRFAGSPIVRGLKYAMTLGAFFWTSHVVAFIAKQSVVDVHAFVAMETGYLVIQFGVFGVLIGWIYRDVEGEV